MFLIIALIIMIIALIITIAMCYIFSNTILEIAKDMCLDTQDHNIFTILDMVSMEIKLRHL